MLDLEVDPKLAWALKHRGLFPVDVNTGDRELLLRVPGLGVKAVDKIIAARRHTRLRLADIRRLSPGLTARPTFPHHRATIAPRASPTGPICANASSPPPVQLSLF